MSYTLLFCIALTLLFSAFFSGMEMAFISADRIRLELDKQEGGWTARILQYFYNHSERFISTMLVGNNIALIIYGILMAQLMEPQLPSVVPEKQVAFAEIECQPSQTPPETLEMFKPDAVLRRGDVLIGISNSVSDSLLRIILENLSHAG